MFDLVFALIRLLLSVRYRITIEGVESVTSKGKIGILILPNHPGLIDPVIVAASLWKSFRIRPLANENQIDRPVIRTLARWIGARPIPDIGAVGLAGRACVEEAVGQCAQGLRNGENILLYPAGHLTHQREEDLGSASAVETLLRQAPECRVVLVRIRGLWGSSFTWASGTEPTVTGVFRKALLPLLASLLFFMPRRAISITLVEPDDLPRGADRSTLNRYLERFYNAVPESNTYVPYSMWEAGDQRTVPEPRNREIAGNMARVPAAIREQVTQYLSALTGQKDVTDNMRLVHELGLDSLAQAELVLWLGREFGTHVTSSESLVRVSDVLLVASGDVASAPSAPLPPVPASWFSRASDRTRVRIPEGDTVAKVFLEQARRRPCAMVCADPATGARTYRDLVTAIILMRKRIAALPGQRVGIMLPASIGADVAYLSTMFAGKTAVMVNWTAGPRNIIHGLELTGVSSVLTARKLTATLERQGIDLSDLADRFVYLEDLGQGISAAEKALTYLKALVSWRDLHLTKISETAVILFTSGSESLPKAVPLTHENVLTNARDVINGLTLYQGDTMLGMLPPFHSFGLAAGIILPFCSGMRVVHHSNPTEGGLLASIIQAYGVTAMVGTPTFLHGIVRSSVPEQLKTLRLIITGAEKCSEAVYDALRSVSPQAVIIEGYGITECSPVVSMNDEMRPVVGSVGKVVPALEWVLVDVERNCRVPTGAVGLLLVRGLSVFHGYLHHSGSSPFVEFEGKSWYRTGDLLRADENGVLTFEGRLKRFIKIGGEMVSLPAIESVLSPHLVGEGDEGPTFAVEATADEVHPEIVLFTVREVDRPTANGWIRDSGLSPLHHVRRVVRIDAIPVLGTGKTDYRRLKDQLAREPSGQGR